MAAVSPIVLNSSSPNSFRIPSVTPPSLQRRSIVPISSSPGLVSPSRFVKPRALVLKSGSRAQQLPDGASTGFASARSLWTLHRAEAGNEDGSEKRQKVSEVENAVERVEGAPRKSTGKLKKPRKTVKTNEPEVACEKALQTSVLEDFKFEDSFATKIEQVARPVVGSRRFEFQARRSTPIRSPSISLSEYAFEVPNEVTKTTSPLLHTKPIKKPRKKASQTAELTSEMPVKKPRKRKKKSESIILNSDEPDFDLAVNARLGEGIKERTTATKDTIETAKKPTKRRPKVPETESAHAGALGRSVVPTGRTELDAGLSASANEQSAYFANPAVQEAQAFDHNALESHHTPIPPNKDAEVEDDGNPIIEAASRRRRSWTPVKDTTAIDLSNSRPPTSHTSISDISQTPKPHLRDIPGNFGYVSNSLKHSDISFERSETGETATKRRRIELSAPINGVAIVGEAPQAAAPASKKVSKRRKAPKKKAQTITALATAAFQAPNTDVTEDTVVSQFFAPCNDVAANTEPSLEKPPPVITKPKKARKPKAQANGEHGYEGSVKPRKPPSPKKVKVKFNKADYLPKLLSPSCANAQLERQDLLFGTSSQLAVDETATFIRDMQAAVRESEAAPRHESNPVYATQASPNGTAISPQQKSCIKVPTAPHGTCLSIEQADRDLWCIASRDPNGVVYRNESTKETPLTRLGGESDHPAALDANEKASSEPSLVVRVDTEGSAVDLCRSSPGVYSADVDTHQQPEQQAPDITDKQQVDALSAPCGLPEMHDAHTEADDTWMLLHSDDSEPALEQRPPMFGPSRGAATLIPAISPSKILSPARFRPPLNPLNPNTIIPAGLGKEKEISQARAFSSTSANDARKPKSPTRRARMHVETDQALSRSPVEPTSKRRGRPPKQKALASDPAPKVSHQTSDRQRVEHLASQPASKSEWVDIDEISDSDSPTTPSPPRRRARSSSPAVRPLPLSPVGSPVVKAKAPAIAAAAGASLKPTDPNWMSTRSTLFPRITSAVKSAPRSNDPSKPSWWQKILLYDPIVLEDLTAWLNEQGLSFEIRKQKPKPKKKGRKGKDAEFVEDEPEWELHEHPLQPWMVQKWCEEKSICCLWKEGSRGGVRTRY